MSNYARDPSRRENLDVTRLAQLFDSWPDSNEYHISECDMVRFYLILCFYELFTRS
jgi:hypothetical protein